MEFKLYSVIHCEQCACRHGGGGRKWWNWTVGFTSASPRAGKRVGHLKLPTPVVCNKVRSQGKIAFNKGVPEWNSKWPKRFLQWIPSDRFSAFENFNSAVIGLNKSKGTEKNRILRGKKRCTYLHKKITFKQKLLRSGRSQYRRKPTGYLCFSINTAVAAPAVRFPTVLGVPSLRGFFYSQLSSRNYSAWRS